MKEQTLQPSESFLVAALLAISGGFLDAYTYVCRGGVFANAQTGNLVLLAVSAVGATPLPRRLYEKVSRSPVFAVLEPIALIALLLVCTAYLVDGSFNPFLYFRF